MNPTEFLRSFVPGFAELSHKERNAIRDFAFLWSAAEWKILQGSANPDAILDAGRRLTLSGLLDDPEVQDALLYFQARYFQNGELTEHFNGPWGLRLRNADHPQLIEGVIRGVDLDPNNITGALLLIVYRLRNNLFHGHKWEFRLHGQLENFTHANNLLMQGLRRA